MLIKLHFSKSVPVIVVCVCIAGCIAIGVLICYCVKKNNKIDRGLVISQQPNMIPINHNAIIFNSNNMSMPPPSSDLTNQNHAHLPPLINKNPKFNDFSNTAKTLPNNV